MYFLVLQALEESNGENIKMFGVMLHSHLAGVGIRVRHIRNGNELPLIDEDNNYDFNFQEFRRLPKEIEIKQVCFMG